MKLYFHTSYQVYAGALCLMQSIGKRLYMVGLSRQHVTVEVHVVHGEKSDK